MLGQTKRLGFSLTLIATTVLIAIGTTVACLQFHSEPHELSAIKAIQTIHQAEVQYKSQFGVYANTLSELGPSRRGPATPFAADLIGRDLSSGVKGGSKFTLAGNPSGYVITAEPVAFGATGSRRTFYTDQTMVIHQNFTAAPATAKSPEMK
jgi:type IV pilus assembly protein PilA